MFFYNIIIRLLYFIIRIAAIWDSKAESWMTGRTKIKNDLDRFNNQGKKSIWFHCASLGEFEQGRPLLEELKIKYPAYNMVVSFFSPSGYQIQRNYQHADLVTYLPRDYPKDLNQFINKVNPKVVIFVKYEYWLNLFIRLDKKHIPRILISAKFTKGKYPINRFGRLTIPLLKKMKHIFVQDEISAKTLSDLAFQNVILSGDTRVDRVVQIAQEKKSLPNKLNVFSENHKIFICGSTWIEDEKLLRDFFTSLPEQWKMILAPHEIDNSHIENLKTLFPEAALLSDDKMAKGQILIMDSIGLLSKAYKVGNLAYVGGAFKTGLHNILEPAAFGLPVIFGPKFDKFNEAIDLVALGGAFTISSLSELNDVFLSLNQPSNYNRANNAIKEYLHHHQGSTQKIYRVLKDSIFR